MIRLFQFLLTGCFHTWETIRKIELYEYTNDSLPCGTKYHMQCTKCGDVKSKRL